MLQCSNHSPAKGKHLHKAKDMHKKNLATLDLPHKWIIMMDEQDVLQLPKRESKRRREQIRKMAYDSGCFSFTWSQNTPFKTRCSTQFKFSHTLPLPYNNYLNHILTEINGWEEKTRKMEVDSLWWVLPMTHGFSQTGSRSTFPPP